MKYFMAMTAAAALVVSQALAQDASRMLLSAQSPEMQMGKMPGMQMNQTPNNGGAGQPPAAPSTSPDRDVRQKTSNQVANGLVPDVSANSGKPLPPPDLLKDVLGRPEIGLAEFLGFAGHENPTLREAQELVRRSEEQARQAGLYPNPSAGYQGEQIRGGEYGGGEQGGFVQQTIVLGGKLGLRRDIFKQQGRADQTAVEEQTYRIHNDVTQAFYTALAAQAAVVVRQRLLAVAGDAVETVHQLANVGQADAPDILQTEVEEEQAKVEFVTAQRQFLQSFRVVAALAGKPDLPPSPLRGALEDVPELDAEQQVDKIVEASPAVKRAEEQIAVEEAKLRDAQRERVPDLDLRAGEQYNGERVTEGLPAKAAGAQSFVTAGVSIPLWNRNQGNIGAAKSDLQRAREDLIRTRLSLKQQAEGLATSYLSARYTEDQYRTELIPRARQAYELYWAKYRSMAQAYPQVLVSQRTLFQLQISYVTALRDVWINAVALENYTLSGALTAPGGEVSSSNLSSGVSTMDSGNRSVE
jgi:outer membrane protein, heavy metal efflux system